jgi:GNAT superfamily N-acetyltransferase
VDASSLILTPAPRLCYRFHHESAPSGRFQRAGARAARKGISYQFMRDFRGHGLAQALKLQTILLAKKEGMRYIRTNNDSNNAPMLAINRKLGYQPEPGAYRIRCVLE